MKKGRFLWSAHRITEKQKAGKARNIKGKRQLKNFNTVSKQLVVHHSSARDNLSVAGQTISNSIYSSSEFWFWGVFLYVFDDDY